MTKNIAIIGLGTICEHYIKAFSTLEKYKVVAVCDLNDDAPARKYFSCPFYNNYQDLAEIKELDYVVISTPPHTHYLIARFFLMNKIGVLMEKPATNDLASLIDLINLSKEKDTLFKIMYHWQYGSEVLKFNAIYNPHDIEEISVCVYDDYSINGIEIKDEKVSLGGAFFDSGVNMLSMIKTWLPFNEFELISYQSQRCQKTNLPIKAEAKLLIDKIPVTLKVDWTTKKSNKETVLIYQGRKIDLNNTLQTIFDGDKSIRVDDMERLDAHYYNLFRFFDDKSNYEEEIKIHTILFDVNEKL